MSVKTIIVPCDGATNIKVSAYDFESLMELETKVTETPTTKINGMNYNCSSVEFSWFDSVISKMIEYGKSCVAISPVSRGASGGMIGKNNRLIDSTDGNCSLAYTQHYSPETDKKFEELCGNKEEFFTKTGSISTMPGSLTLIKRLLYEEMERPEISSKAAAFATYPVLMSGHFTGDNLKAAAIAGNEHSYWMCHTGSRDINGVPGTPSHLCGKIQSYTRLVQAKPSNAYKPVGKISQFKAEELSIPGNIIVMPGGHDTCFSHIPIASSFYQNFPEMKGKAFLHVEIGTWIMGALIGGFTPLTKDMFGKGIIVQGTVDGNPVLTTMYAGGSDFKYLKQISEEKGLTFKADNPEKILYEILKDCCCFVQPNINPGNRGHGPFPALAGRIINENYFLSSGEKAFILSNLMSALTTSHHACLISSDKSVPVVITGGGAKGKLFGELLGALTGKNIYTIYQENEEPLVETTSLGAAIIGKAGYLNKHPYEVDVSGMNVKYRQSAHLSSEIGKMLNEYKTKYFANMANG